MEDVDADFDVSAGADQDSESDPDTMQSHKRREQLASLSPSPKTCLYTWPHCFPCPLRQDRLARHTLSCPVLMVANNNRRSLLDLFMLSEENTPGQRQPLLTSARAVLSEH
jgi:hypothetical protein